MLVIQLGWRACCYSTARDPPPPKTLFNVVVFLLYVYIFGKKRRQTRAKVFVDTIQLLCARPPVECPNREWAASVFDSILDGRSGADRADNGWMELMIDPHCPTFFGDAILYLPFGFRLYSSFPGSRNHKRDMSFSEVTTVASFAPSSAIHLSNLGPGSNGKSRSELTFFMHFSSFSLVPLFSSTVWVGDIDCDRYMY